MKQFSKYMLEALDNALKQRLLDAINNEEIDDITAKKMLSMIDSNSYDMQKVKDWFTDKGIEDDMRNIIRIVKDYDAFDALYKVILDENTTLVDSDDFVNADNVYKLFHDNNPAFSKELLSELAEENPSRNSITRGMFEIVCQMFLKDIAKGNSSKSGVHGHGDVNTTKHGYSLEFKTPGARVKSQKEHSAKLIDDSLKAQLQDLGVMGVDCKKAMNSQKDINRFVEQVTKAHDFTDDQLFELFANALFAQYDVTDWSNLIDRNSIQKACVSNGKVDAIAITKLMGCIQLKYYQQEEDWTHIVIFKGKTGSDAIKSGDYACLEGSYASDINKIFFDKHIKLYNGGNGYASVRDHYCQIQYN